MRLLRVVPILLVSACNSQGPAKPVAMADGGTTTTHLDLARPGTLTPEERTFFDNLRAKEKAKAAIRANPDRYLKTGRLGRKQQPDNPLNPPSALDWDTAPELPRLELTNSSDFDLLIMAGRITYRGAAGEELGTVPFTANGEVPAHGFGAVPVEVNKVGGSPASFTATVTKVRVLE